MPVTDAGTDVLVEDIRRVLLELAKDSNLASLPVYDAAELARHNTETSKWVVVDGYVYDVTHFKHPGGNDKLFDNAGTDVSKLFYNIKHSPQAHKLLAKMLQGRFDKGSSAGSSAPASPAVPRARPREATSRTPPPPLAMDVPPNLHSLSDSAQRGGGRVGHDRPEHGADHWLTRIHAGSLPYHLPERRGETLWSTRRRGFLPSRDPIKECAHATATFQVLLELVHLMPTALAEGTFRSRVLAEEARFAPLAAAIADETSADVLERVHGLYGYIGKGFVHGIVGEDGAQVVPSFLAAGWYSVSAKLGRHPTIDYADCVLYNWERIDAGGPLTPENIRLLNRFTGLLDEEWFLKTHVIIESEAAGVIRAIMDAMRAITKRDWDTLLALLGQVEQSMSHVATNCLWIMFERSEDEGFLCEPDFFFHRFRPYISTWTALFEGQYESTERLQELQEELQMVERLSKSPSALPDLEAHRKHLKDSIHDLQARRRLAGPSGAMSTLLPLCDAFCDIRMSSAELGKMLEVFEEYMPLEHRELLQTVRECPARPVIVGLAKEGHPQAATLVDHFNAVVRRVLDFRWRHLSYIEQYVLKPSGTANARGTGGTPAFHYLNQHISDTEAALIAEVFSRKPSRDEDEDDFEDDDGEQPRDTGPRNSNDNDNDESANLADAPAPMWIVSNAHGLLPSTRPIESASLPPSWTPVINLATAVPSACVPPPTFRTTVTRSLAELPTTIHDLADDAQRERARCLLAFIAAGWSASGIDVATPRSRAHSGAPELPEPLRGIFQQLSDKLGRATRLSLVDYVLYNWRMRPPTTANGHGDGPPGLSKQTTSASEDGVTDVDVSDSSAAVAATAAALSGAARTRKPSHDETSSRAHTQPHLPRPGLKTLSHIFPMQRFLCVEEEAWFCRLHVALAGEAAIEMTALRRCFDASNSGGSTVEQQVRGLQHLEAALEVLVRVHYASGIGQPIGQDSTPNMRPELLMHRLHRFLPLINAEAVFELDADEQRAARVYCATGIDQSALLHLMGVKRGGHKIEAFREWQQSDEAAELPKAHREYLKRCLAKMSMRECIERAVTARVLSINDLSRLELAYNSCIDMMLRYFARRNELVRQMFGADTLKDAFDHERSAILAARLKLLVERREENGQLMSVPSYNDLSSTDLSSTDVSSFVNPGAPPPPAQ